MSSSGVALLLACAIFVSYEVFAFRRELTENITVLASAIGTNCAPAVDFHDSRAAEETLNALHASDNVLGAAVYTSDEKLFAFYKRNQSASVQFPSSPGKGHFFENGHLKLFYPVKLQKNSEGSIFVVADQHALTDRLTRFFGIAGIVFSASFLTTFILSKRLQNLISDPIINLLQVTRSVAIDREYSTRASKQNNDELGQLVDGFNEMLTQIQLRDKALREEHDNLEKRVEERTRELQETHKQLIDISRKAGMAEIATNILHNVGNVLNSLNVSVNFLSQRIKKSKVGNLSKIAGLLDEHKHDLGDFLTEDLKGRQVPIYLSQLGRHLKEEQIFTLEELDSLRDNIEHINEIVAMQQSYATVSGLEETVNIRDLVEDSLRMSEDTFKNHRIELQRHYENVDTVNIDKHKILQILINLVRNAKFACIESGQENMRITIHTFQTEKEIKISIADNGIGIASENLTRIFNHGFTTRKGGHGFGLHGGALSAREMGGALIAKSEGLGKGATFTLVLPKPKA